MGIKNIVFLSRSSVLPLPTLSFINPDSPIYPSLFQVKYIPYLSTTTYPSTPRTSSNISYYSSSYLYTLILSHITISTYNLQYYSSTMSITSSTNLSHFSSILLIIILSHPKLKFHTPNIINCHTQSFCLTPPYLLRLLLYLKIHYLTIIITQLSN